MKMRVLNEDAGGNAYFSAVRIVLQENLPDLTEFLSASVAQYP